MEITGSLTIGNGEKCPFCEEILDDNIEGKEILPHIEKYHKKELIKKLFPEKKEKKEKELQEECAQIFDFIHDFESYLNCRGQIAKYFFDKGKAHKKAKAGGKKWIN